MQIGDIRCKDVDIHATLVRDRAWTDDDGEQPLHGYCSIIGLLTLIMKTYGCSEMIASSFIDRTDRRLILRLVRYTGAAVGIGSDVESSIPLPA